MRKPEQMVYWRCDRCDKLLTHPIADRDRDRYRCSCGGHGTWKMYAPDGCLLPKDEKFLHQYAKGPAPNAYVWG